MDKILKAADNIAEVFNVKQNWLDSDRSKVVKILKKVVAQNSKFTNSRQTNVPLKVRIIELISELEDTVASNEDCHHLVTKLKYAAQQL